MLSNLDPAVQRELDQFSDSNRESRISAAQEDWDFCLQPQMSHDDADFSLLECESFSDLDYAEGLEVKLSYRISKLLGFEKADPAD